jgi:hypothetical protein
VGHVFYLNYFVLRAVWPYIIYLYLYIIIIYIIILLFSVCRVGHIVIYLLFIRCAVLGQIIIIHLCISNYCVPYGPHCLLFNN